MQSPRPRRRLPEPLPVEASLWDFPGVEGFLQAIAEEPWDDTHRLILADWLDDGGAPERAEFIRLQCRLERDGLSLLSSVEVARFWELAHTHQREWLTGLPAEVSLYCGLATRISARASSSDPVGDLLMAARAVDVQELSLPPASAWDALVARPELRSAVSVHARTRGNLPRLCRVLDVLAPLSLTLVDCTLRASDIEYLGRLPGLGGLIRLNVRQNELGSGGGQALAQTLFAETLEHLNLSENNLTDPDVTDLAKGRWPRLRTLDLSFNRLGAVGLRALLESPMTAGLEGLSLRHNPRDREVRQALLEAPDLKRLRRLALGGLWMYAHDLEAIRDRWPGLEVLA